MNVITENVPIKKPKQIYNFLWPYNLWDALIFMW